MEHDAHALAERALKKLADGSLNGRVVTVFLGLGRVVTSTGAGGDSLSGTGAGGDSLSGTGAGGDIYWDGW